MRGLPLLRRLFAGIQALDRANWPVFRLVPAVWKRRLVRALFRSADGALRRGEPVDLEGLRWSIPEAMRSTFVLQRHEPGVRRVLERLLRPGMVVVDVGANIGYHTVFAARLVGPEGKVFAIEPDESNRAHLRENLNLNASGSAAVEILPVAAGSVFRRRSFHRRPDPGHHGFHPHPVEETLEVIEVDERPLDDLVEGTVDLVKIDVEAGELEVLEGMERILRENPEIRLVLEWNPPLMLAAGLQPQALPEHLTALGFELTVIEGPEGELQPLDLDRISSDHPHDLLAMRPAD